MAAVEGGRAVRQLSCSCLLQEWRQGGWYECASCAVGCAVAAGILVCRAAAAAAAARRAVLVLPLRRGDRRAVDGGVKGADALELEVLP